MNRFTLYIGCFAWLFLGMSLLSLHGQILEDEQFHEAAAQGLESMYNMQFKAADTAFDRLSRDYPTHPGPHLMQAANQMWQLSLDEKNQRFDSRLLSEVELALKLNKSLKELPDAKVEGLICELTGLTLKARCLAIRGNWAASANTARKCIPLVKEGRKMKQDSKEYSFFLGTYDYFVEAYPAKYPIVKPFMVFFPNGDRKRGMVELKTAAESRLMVQGEAAYQLALILLDYEHQYAEGLRLSKRLHNRFPRNSMFSFLYGVALYQNKLYMEAETVLGKLETTYEKIPNSETKKISPNRSPVTSRLMMEVYYYAGLVKMIEYEDAKGAILRLNLSRKMARLSNFTDHDVYLAALYHIAVNYDRLGERETALKLYDEVIQKDKSGGYKPRAKKCRETPCYYDF